MFSPKWTLSSYFKKDWFLTTEKNESFKHKIELKKTLVLSCKSNSFQLSLFLRTVEQCDSVSFCWVDVVPCEGLNNSGSHDFQRFSFKNYTQVEGSLQGKDGLDTRTKSSSIRFKSPHHIQPARNYKKWPNLICRIIQKSSHPPPQKTSQLLQPDVVAHTSNLSSLTLETTSLWLETMLG